MFLFSFAIEAKSMVFHPFSPLPVSKPIVCQKSQLLIFLSSHSSLSKCNSSEKIAPLSPFFFQFLHQLFSCWDLSWGAFLKRAVYVSPAFCHCLNQSTCIVHQFSVWGFTCEFVVKGFHCCKDFQKLLLSSR